MIFSIKNTLMSWVMRKRIHQIELFVKYPHDVQKDWLESLISTARFTEFGKKYHFDEIISYLLLEKEFLYQIMRIYRPLLKD